VGRQQEDIWDVPQRPEMRRKSGVETILNQLTHVEFDGRTSAYAQKYHLGRSRNLNRTG